MIPADLKSIYNHCELCPRRCGADRSLETGFCGCTSEIRAAKAMLHYWEEPVVTQFLSERAQVRKGGDGESSASFGTRTVLPPAGALPENAENRPSGAVFFSGCTLGCLYCQNYRISHENFGKILTPGELADIFLRLQAEGAANIDLVTPTHFLPGILEALDLCKPFLNIPVMYNCGGYERREIVELLEETVEIWLPDIKYCSDETAKRYSAAPGYFETALEAAGEMLRQVKAAEAQGRKKLMVLRHMVLPGQKNDSIRLLRELADRLGTEGYDLSLMSQYTPFYKASEHPEINRRLTTYEYEKVLEEALNLGFDGFRQERTSAKEEYTPVFDLSGL